MPVARSLHAVDASLGNHVRTLPVVTTFQHHHHAAGFDVTEPVAGVVTLSRDAKPQDIDGRADVVDNQTGTRANRRMAAITSDHEIGANFKFAVR